MRSDQDRFNDDRRQEVAGVDVVIGCVSASSSARGSSSW